MYINICTSLQFGTIQHLWFHTVTSQTWRMPVYQKTKKNGLICVRNAELCDAGIFNFVSFCHVFIQLLACNPKPGCLCHLQHILSSAEYVNQTHVPENSVLQPGAWAETHPVFSLFLFFLFVSGANPKKPSAPDMFTESDDMFAADFDVSVFNSEGENKCNV